jgi:hypothetical protein
VLFQKVVIHWWVCGVRQEINDKLYEDECLLTLGGYEIKVKFLNNYNPTSEITIDKLSIEEVLHGIGICDDSSGSK